MGRVPSRIYYHFICEQCGSIIDLNIPMDEEINKKVEETTSLKARRHRIEFFGLCDKCSAEKKN